MLQHVSPQRIASSILQPLRHVLRQALSLEADSFASVRVTAVASQLVRYMSQLHSLNDCIILTIWLSVIEATVFLDEYTSFDVS